MYITTVVPLMRAYNLSFNEYAVLETIRNLSTLKKLDFWCVVSQQKIADGLGLSRRWISGCYKALEAKELIERRKIDHTDTAVRTTDEWNEWFSPINERYLLYLKTETTEIVSGNIEEFKTWLHSQVENTPSSRKCYTPLAESATPLAESAHNTNNNTNSDITILSKDKIQTGLYETENQTDLDGRTDRSSNQLMSTPGVSDVPRELAWGKPEINVLLNEIKEKVGITDFVDSALERNIADHCLSLIFKITRREFFKRLDILLLDNFHSKNCNKIKYIYSNIKGFIKRPSKIKSQSGVFVADNSGGISKETMEKMKQHGKWEPTLQPVDNCTSY